MRPIPTTVISGFLGAGKTTLVNRILSEEHELEVAVIVNDVGALDIDAELISQFGGDLVSLKNGCVCCSLRGDLVNQMSELADRKNFDHIIIEASGASEPGNISRAMRYPQLRGKVFDAAVITIVDAELFPGLTGHSKYLAGEQLAAADIVILNKIDLVTSAQLDAATERCTCPGLPVLPCQYANAPLDIIFPNSNAPRRPARKEADLNSVESFETRTWVPSAPVSIDSLRSALGEISETVIRVKGFVQSHGSGRKWLVQVVGRRINIVRSESAGISGLVLIAIAGNTNWDSCFELLNSSLRRHAH